MEGGDPGDGVEGKAVAGAQAGQSVARQIPREADAGADVVAVGLDGGARDAGVAWEEKSWGRIGADGGLAARLEGSHAVLLVVVGQRQFVAKAQVESETGVHFPVVLEEEAARLPQEVLGRLAASLAELSGQSEQEVGVSVGAECAGHGKVAVGAVGKIR